MVANTYFNSQTSLFRAHEGVKNGSILTRTWNAVVDFFTQVAPKIKGWVETALMTIENWVNRSSKASGANLESSSINVVTLSHSLRGKLALYDKMPKGNALFLRKAIDILRIVLQRKDEKIAAALQQEIGVGPEGWAQLKIPNNRLPNHLSTFNSQIEALEGECFPKILMAAIRAFIFAKSDSSNYGLSYFGHVEKVADAPLPRIPGVHIGGPQVRSQFIDYIPQLKQIKAKFEQLSDGDKEIILDEFDPSNIDALNLSSHGKKILKEISRIQNALLQNNASFAHAAQAVLTGGN